MRLDSLDCGPDAMKHTYKVEATLSIRQYMTEKQVLCHEI
jgi:hypothetical protein